MFNKKSIRLTGVQMKKSSFRCRLAMNRAIASFPRLGHRNETQQPTPKSVWIFLLGFLGSMVGFPDYCRVRRLGWANKYVKENLSILRESETQQPTPKSVWIFFLGFLGSIVGFPWVNPTYGSFFGCIVGFPDYCRVRRLGWANKYVKENLSILRKSETQHPTPKSVWIFLLGFLGCIVGFPWVYCWVSCLNPTYGRNPTPNT
jgi:ribosomal protein L37E